MTLAAWSIQKLFEPLVIFGLAGQCVFMLRFVVQWFASERRGRSYVPIGFWYLSVVGGLMLLVYGVLDEDPVILLGQSLGMTIYARNLFLIYARRARYQRRRANAQPPPDGAAGVPAQSDASV